MSAKSRILVVDDDPNIRDLVRTYLDAAGYDVCLARDGGEVRSKVADVDPDAIILDINMPNMDGFAVLEALKPIFQKRRLPVLVLTARHGPDDVRRAISLGAKDYLAKPFQKDQLLARVARLVHRTLAAVARV